MNQGPTFKKLSGCFPKIELAKMKHYLKFQFSFLAALLILTACDTPASPERIDDPSFIKPQILVMREINNSDGSAVSLITVKLKDKNENYIELIGGKITVNGLKMSAPSAWNGKYYKSTANVVDDSIYAFEITFSGGAKGYAWIETPEIEFRTMTVPLEHPRSTDLTVTWSKTDYRYPQYLAIHYWTPENSFSSKDQVQMNIRTPYLGSCLVDKKYMVYRNLSDGLVEETRIILIAETNGLLEDSFMVGGYIQSQIKIWQDIFVY